MKNIEIAKKLHISTAAVSLALNNKPGVSEETRKKVIALKESSLINDIEKFSDTKKADSLGLFCYQMDHKIIAENPYFWSILSYLSEAAHQRGYSLNIRISNEKSLFDQTHEMNASGCSGYFIFAPKLTYEDIQIIKDNLLVPYVLIDAYFAIDGINCILPDNQSGIMQAIKYAISMGHKEIGFIGNQKATNSIMDRYQGFCKTLMKNRLPERKEWILSDRRSDGYGYQIDFELPEQLPTAFICNCDKSAYLLAEKLQELGYQVPEDISIAGFDYYGYQNKEKMKLVTYENDERAIAQISVSILMRRIEGKHSSGEIRIVEGKFIHGNTVRNLKS